MAEDGLPPYKVETSLVTPSENVAEAVSVKEGCFNEWLHDFSFTQKVGVVLSVIVLIVVYSIELSDEFPKANDTLACSLFITIWWIFEVMPVAMTSILPVIIFPLAGITSGRDTASRYYNFIQFLFIGAFLVVVAIEEVKAHKRFALKVVSYIGTKPKRILAGLMFVAFILSMFASNTSTTILLVPIVSGLVHGEQTEDAKRFEKGALLGIAYAATSGGLATLIGTLPNGIFAGVFSETYPDAEEITFSKWMGFALPAAILMALSSWVVVGFMYMRNLKINLSNETILDDLKALGPVSRDEKFLLAAILFMLTLFLVRPEGISPYVGECSISSSNSSTSNEFDCEDVGGVWTSFIDDGTMSCLAATVLFFLPSEKRKGERILTAESFNHIRFDMLLLFGAGFAIANAFTVSGLSIVIGDLFSTFVNELSPFATVLMITFVVCYFTEMTSNTATSSILIPIMLGVATTTETNPYLLGLPVTLGASLAFMLPIATPPNTVVYSTGKVTFADMMKAGFILNNIGIIVVTGTVFSTGNIFTDLQDFPAFAAADP
mmetsp:Transcript_6490/g.7421  ORF Transcript_6490/g.7421 Transcript_6490/m.7421 type:complete len:550 (+) Transcript_6490:210-1859(+)